MTAEHPPVRSVIAVDGIDGSGKSVLARRLADVATRAGIENVILGVDDFRRPVAWGQAHRSEAQTYYDDYYDLPLLDRCLAGFGAGAQSVDIPFFDSSSDRIDGSRPLSFGAATLAIVEGVFARRLAAVAAGAALVYLRTSFPEARRRIVARDTARGRSLADVTHRIDARYFPAQERYLRDFDPVGHADVLIDNERFDAPDVVRFNAGRFDAHTAALLRRMCTGMSPVFASPVPVG
ncbi:MAG: hypothetical protein ABUR63_01665 [Verrucomicrobiota bacterium]